MSGRRPTRALSYHPTDSFEMVSTLVYYALLVVAVPQRSSCRNRLGDLTAMAKAKPASISFGSVGFGSTHHLAGELLNAAAGTGNGECACSSAGIPQIHDGPVERQCPRGGRHCGAARAWDRRRHAARPGSDIANQDPVVAQRCPRRNGRAGLKESRRSHVGRIGRAERHRARRDHKAQCRLLCSTP